MPALVMRYSVSARPVWPQPLSSLSMDVLLASAGRDITKRIVRMSLLTGKVGVYPTEPLLRSNGKFWY